MSCSEILHDATPPMPAAPSPAPYPAPGSPEELARFAALQRGLAPMFRRVFGDPHAPRTVVVVPSLSLDAAELKKLEGAPHYEERLLCLLLLLRLPARVVYVTSQPVSPAIVDYYLRLCDDVPYHDARRRLTMLHCDDGGPAPLTEKILARPELVERIRALVGDPASTHLACFNSTALERTLAVRLGVPLYGCDPELGHLGTKSGSRTVFRSAGVPLPAGYEHLRGVDDVARALGELRRENPRLQRAVVKLEEGFSGEGNAIFSYDGTPAGPAAAAWIRANLASRMRCVAPGENWERFAEKFARIGGIVEAFVDGTDVRSPSVQCRIDPLGGTRIISTHDQVLGGPTHQVYLGCTFPADARYAADLDAPARRVTEVLAARGVVGRFGIDFLSRRTPTGWEHEAIEINLRKGGTTHPFWTLQLLTDGDYDGATALYHSAAGRPCYYAASDNIQRPSYRGLGAEALLAAAGREGLLFDAGSQSGVVFHLLGALPRYGKLGAVAIGRTREHADALFRQAVALLDGAARSSSVGCPIADCTGAPAELPAA